ncbi:homoserine kinase [Acaryochloris sp. CCMEE 5410]|uniref:homoserine kinase n=1 Tax=Acaryochloris sp. CCMEE 5410 TaxID=310037 RepID=UPI000248433E|nr:homoserine kinase [Acaryochloris sp. CCMEE 5410]KAI9133113.1 homoserine kinase [Acaryochloris sp. CCMEE 5410]
MSNTQTLTIQVPATTANIGPGFDCLGAALSLHNRFQFTLLSDPSESPRIQATGHGVDQLPTDDQNLVYRAFAATYQHLGQTPPAIQIDIHLEIPQARGLGSSATAIIAGLIGANELANQPLDQSELLQLAINLEGHPDNVVPAMLGGCCLAAETNDRWQICSIDWSPEVVPIVAIPDFELKTDLARNALPDTCGYGDAIFNMAHLGFLLKGLEQADPTLLKTALEDKLHQPYRLKLIPGYRDAYQAAQDAGAYGLVISGAGPTLLALGSRESADAIASTIRNQWQTANRSVKTQVLKIDRQGAIAQFT